MKKIIKNYLSYLYNFIRIIPYAKNRKYHTLYISTPSKSFWRLYYELILVVSKEGFYSGKQLVPEIYYQYGLDCVDRNLKDYLFRLEMKAVEDKINEIRNPFYFGFTDKRIASIVLEFFGLPHNPPTGVLDKSVNGNYEVQKLNGKPVSWTSFLQENNKREFFLKFLTGHGGEGINKIDSRCLDRLSGMSEQEQNEFAKSIKTPAVLEPVIQNHPDISLFHPNSLNTIRIVTIMRKGMPELVAAIFRIGAGSEAIDNFSKGGVSVKIDFETGTLNRHGLQKGVAGNGFTHHPDTNVKFEGKKIPYWDDIKGIVLTGHLKLKYPHTIGWDIGVSPEGPVIVELNRYPGLLMVQEHYGGWRKIFNKYYLKELALLVENNKI